MQCEICRMRATHCCAGLDIPAIYFCEPHGVEHAQTCPSCRDGRSQTVQMGTQRVELPKPRARGWDKFWNKVEDALGVEEQTARETEK